MLHFLNYDLVQSTHIRTSIINQFTYFAFQTTSIDCRHLQDIPVYLKPSIDALTTAHPVASAIHKLQQESEQHETVLLDGASTFSRKRKRQLDPLKDFVGVR